MKYLFLGIVFLGFLITPVFAQEQVNPSLILEDLEIPGEDFNTVLREAPIIPLDNLHSKSWQVTIDNNILNENPNGNARFRIYEKENTKIT